MGYTPKLDWTPPNGVSAADMIRIEQGIKDALPKDGSEAMTGNISISKSAPRVILKRTDAANRFTGIDISDNETSEGALYFDHDNNEFVYMNPLAQVFKLWHSGNDGAGSGIDTDFVRGKVALLADGSEPITGYLTFPRVDSTTLNLDRSIGANSFIGFSKPGTWLFRVDESGVAYALGNRVWDTGILRVNAGVLEYLDGGTWKAAGGVKSIQSGSAVHSGAAFPQNTDIPISAVNTAKSEATITGSGVNVGISFISSTVVRLTWYGPYRGYDENITWQVKENW